MDYIELEVEKILWHTLCEILGTPLRVTLPPVILFMSARVPLGSSPPVSFSSLLSFLSPRVAISGAIIRDAGRRKAHPLGTRLEHRLGARGSEAVARRSASPGEVEREEGCSRPSINNLSLISILFERGTDGFFLRPTATASYLIE